MIFDRLRRQYHKAICQKLLSVDSSGVPNNADRHSAVSVALAVGIIHEIAQETSSIRSPGQTAGKSFEKLTAAYLQETFQLLHHLRPGEYKFFIGKSINEFEQYEHLGLLSKALKRDKALRAILGDYLISPDIVIGRLPVDDSQVNVKKLLIKGAKVAGYTPLRNQNSTRAILHASISCKWTIRSDRSQNARTEGLNLIRNRKGHTPHIAIITADPYPQRIASLALGTGDIDCVYHFALRELQKAVQQLGNESVSDALSTLVEGKRLRDISDLPFDLAI